MNLLDTDILIDIQRRYPPAVEWFSTLVELPGIPGFVAMELVQGTQNRQEVRQVQRLIAPLPIVWPNEQACAMALSNYARLHLSHRLGLLDALIAACAIQESATLCTFNQKHYRSVPGLQTIQPYKT